MAGENFDWQRLSADEMERHFNPRISVPDFDSYISAYQHESDSARAKLAHRSDIRYGESPRQLLDVFPSNRPDAPIHIFIHGGYWRALNKEDFAFIAPPLVAAGATVVVVEYDLCPNVSLDKIVSEIREAIAWVATHADAIGGSADKILLSGQSAGAHLAAMAVGFDWTSMGLAADLIKGAVLVSGIYDPSPVLQISVNDDVRLTAEMAARNNAGTMPPTGGAPVLVAVGGAETEGWIDQSRRYHAAAGITEPLLVVADADHFSIARDMANPEHALCRAMLAQI